jgi:hypothetical protein
MSSEIALKAKIDVYESSSFRSGKCNSEWGDQPSPKLAAIKCDTIELLTEELVTTRVDEGVYSKEMFELKVPGIVDFIAGMSKDEDQCCYVCTDPSRLTFYRLDENRKWQKDDGEILVTIFNTLTEKAEVYHEELIAETRKPIENYDFKTRDAICAKERGLRPIRYGLRSKEDEQPNRDALMKKVKRSLANRLRV